MGGVYENLLCVSLTVSPDVSETLGSAVKVSTCYCRSTGISPHSRVALLLNIPEQPFEGRLAKDVLYEYHPTVATRLLNERCWKSGCEACRKQRGRQRRGYLDYADEDYLGCSGVTEED